MDLDKKIALLSVAAGTSLLAIAVLYYLTKEPAKIQEDIIEAIKLLGSAKYDSKENKILQKQYFVDLVAIVKFHTQIEFKAEKAELTKKRRELYSEEDENKKEYEDAVREIYEKEEFIFNQLFDEVLQELNIDSKVFFDSQMFYLKSLENDPWAKQNIDVALRDGKPTAETLNGNQKLSMSLQNSIGPEQPQARLETLSKFKS